MNILINLFMYLFGSFKIKRAALILLSVFYLQLTLLAFSQPAPVYDVDEMPAQVDPAEQSQVDEMPPPPESENTFVPLSKSTESGDTLQSEGSLAHQSGQSSAFAPSRPDHQASHTSSTSVTSENAFSNNPFATTAPSPNNAIEERLQRIEQQLYSVQDNAQSSDSSPRIDFLLEQMKLLRAQVEQLTKQIQQIESERMIKAENIGAPSQETLGSSQKKSSDLSPTGHSANNKMITNPTGIENKKAVNSLTVLAAKSPQPNVAEEQQIYQTAYNFIKLKKYNDAVNALQSMLKRYPTGQFASNAHYWLGELYGVLGKNDKALNEFATVVKSYSDSPRVSDAQLKIGLIYAAELKWVDAKSAFKKVINHYPGTTSSRLAAEQLKQLKLAGHS